MAAFTGNLRKKEVHRAITLHPVKQHQYQHHVLNHFHSLRVEEANFKIINMKVSTTESSVASARALDRVGRSSALFSIITFLQFLFQRILRDLGIALGEQTASTPDVDANHLGTILRHHLQQRHRISRFSS